MSISSKSVQYPCKVKESDGKKLAKTRQKVKKNIATIAGICCKGIKYADVGTRDITMLSHIFHFPSFPTFSAAYPTNNLQYNILYNLHAVLSIEFHSINSLTEHNVTLCNTSVVQHYIVA